jgi:hypothetical protein
MKPLKTSLIALTLTLLAGSPALAAYVDTSRTYSSGILIGLFLGFCALIVVVQLVPSIMMLVAFIREAMAKRQAKPRRQGVGVR